MICCSPTSVSWMTTSLQKESCSLRPQSKLPLRLALLVDTSGSVHNRFSFEKRAAIKFVEKMLSGDF